MAFTPDALIRNSGVAATMNAISSLGVSVSTGIVALKDDESIAFLVDMTTTEIRSLTVTLKKGSRWGSDLGDTTITVGPTTSGGVSRKAKFIGPFESYRYKDADGNITFTAAWSTDTVGTWGTLTVFKMPNKV
jgi:hypothetical protein